METAALENALNAQAAMGQLIVEVLGRASEVVAQNPDGVSQPTPESGALPPANGVGENIDVTA